MVILRNRLECTNCGDTIESHHRHDYVECSCGKCMVDGGKDYLRRSMSGFEKPLDVLIPSFEDKSIDTTRALWYDFLRFFDTNSGVIPSSNINDYNQFWPDNAALGHPAVLCMNFVIRNRERISELLDKEYK